MAIKALLKTSPHPTFVELEDVYYNTTSHEWVCRTTEGMNYSTKFTLTNGCAFGDDVVYSITDITEDSVVVLDCSGNFITYSLNDLEWNEESQDYFIRTEDEIDEYTSGYTDAIRDCAEYLSLSEDEDGKSVIRKTLSKLDIHFLASLDTDEKIAKFISKRFEKKPQFTLDDLKRIVGYDFDLV